MQYVAFNPSLFNITGIHKIEISINLQEIAATFVTFLSYALAIVAGCHLKNKTLVLEKNWMQMLNLGVVIKVTRHCL